MSSESDYHSSSSPQLSAKKRQDQRSRSRSRDRDRERDKKYDRERNQGRDKKLRIKMPNLLHPLVNFKNFSIIQTERVNKDIIEKAYERYKKDWDEKQAELFLHQYKNDAWFIEKYDPEMQDAFERERQQHVRKMFVDFSTKLANGYYATIDFRVNDVASVGSIYQNEKGEDEEQSNNGQMGGQALQVHIANWIDITKAPYFGFDPDLHTLFIKCVPRTVSRADIFETVSLLEGYLGITISDPVKKFNLMRYCWIEFASEETCAKAELALNGVIIKNETLVVNKSTSKAKRVKVLKNYPRSRLETDLQTVLNLAKTLDHECEINDNPLFTKGFPSLQVGFDTLLLYLRRVHAYDYFSSAQFENQRILSLKVGSAFLRVEADYEQVAIFQTIFKKIQQNSEKRCQNGSERPDYLALLREQVQKFIRDVQKVSKDQLRQIWKCLYCDKKFKTCQFLAKHMISKHPEVKNKKIQSLMQQSYLRDPNKITLNSLLREDKDYARRKYVNPGYHQKRRREYKDYDQPEVQKTTKTVVKPLVNFLDI